MAKTAKTHADEEEQSSALVAQAHSQDAVPAEFYEDMEGFAGAGISDRTEDFLLPFLYLAQSNSPQLKKQQQDVFIPGLEAGDIFSTATKEFWSGEKGIVVIPAFFQKAEVEWVPRSSGGGYVATHSIDTPLRRQVVMGGEANRFRMLPSGNQLVETSYHFVIVVDSMSPAVIGMTSTALQTSRQWNTLMKDRKIRTRAGQLVSAPCFSRAYRLRTAYKKNDQGDWFAPIIEDIGWAQGSPELDDARQLAKMFYVQSTEKGVQMGRPPEVVPAADSNSDANSGPRDVLDDGDLPI